MIYKQVGMQQLPGLSLCLDRRSKVFVERRGTLKVCRVHIPNEFIKWITASSSPLMELIFLDWWFADVISYHRPHISQEHSGYIHAGSGWRKQSSTNVADLKTVKPWSLRYVWLATLCLFLFFWTLGRPDSRVVSSLRSTIQIRKIPDLHWVFWEDGWTNQG